MQHHNAYAPRTPARTRPCHNARVLTPGLPTQMGYLHVYWKERSGQTNISMKMNVELKYYVKWFDRMPLGGS